MDPKSPNIHFVIPCAGVGARAGRDTPKQYAQLAAKPMIAHTLEALLRVESAKTICLVVSPSDSLIEDILSKYVHGNLSKVVVVKKGGDTRALSVLAGLKHHEGIGVPKDAWVLVHDAARCLISPELVEHLIKTCKDDEVGGLLAVPVADTLKQEEGGRVKNTITRGGKWSAQTPQMFRLEMLGRALQSELSKHAELVTDESSAIESLGLQPILVRGHSTNFKITYPEDFEIAQAVLESRLR